MKPLQALDVELAGVQLIEASAGTGKTFAITTLALRGVLERQLDPSRVLVVTFTNAATAELRRRLRERLRHAWQLLGTPQPTAADDPDLTTYLRRRVAAGHAPADRQRLRAALDGFDDAAVFTIHGFCQRLLRELAFECGAAFDAELLGDPRPLLLDVLRDFWTARLYDARPALVDGLAAQRVTFAALAGIAGAFVQHPDLRVRAGAPPAADAPPAAVFARQLVHAVGPAVREALAARKAAANLQDFDDLLRQVERALAGDLGERLAAAIRGRFPLALIDEFQDTDPVQFDIFQRVYAHPAGTLFMIGDPKQAIYAFRGADVFAYLRAKRDAGRGHSLLTNWRSAPRLVAAVNTLFSRPADAFRLAGIAFEPGVAAARNRDRLGGAAPLRLLFAERARHGLAPGEPINRGAIGAEHWWPRAIAERVVALLDAERLDGAPLRPADIAVLCRTNDQLHVMHAALRAAGVPSVVLGDASVFEAPEAAWLEQLLRALAEPGDARAVRAALVTPLFGVDAAGLAHLAADEAAWEEWVERFQHWGERWRAAGFTAAVRGLLDDREVPARLLAQPDGERHLTNLYHLCELAQQAAADGHRGPRNLVEWLRRLRGDATLRRELGSDAAQVRLESDAHAVTLNTVHRSKGLEYPVVVLPFAWHTPGGRRDQAWPRFHDPASGALTIDLDVPPAEDSEARRATEAAAEDMRLLYVAMTRAQQLCLVGWAAFRDFGVAALATLLHACPRRAEGERRPPALISKLDDDALRDDLAALAAADDAIVVEPLAPAAGRRYAPAAAEAAALVAPPAVAPRERAWRIGSFTSLAAGGEALGRRAAEGLDRDELADAAPQASAGPGPLTGFPRGRGPGTLVHRIFELIDFQLDDDAARRAIIARQLAVAGLGGEWIEPLAAAVAGVLDTPLLPGDPPLRLRDVPRARRRDEMEFAYPVTPAGGGLTPAALADVFARHAGSAGLRAYAERLRRLPFRPLRGFLRGYIDCVFAHQGRWYVVDYKSNDLGAAAADYAPAALAAEMERHDYLLQYHLYVVAVHRYLRRRLPTYDYARDMGGALYLFVRGMAPARGPATGVVHDRPPPALIDALDRLLAGAATEGA